MGKKKSNKEPETATATATDTQDDTGSAPSSDIFKTLFGDVDAEAAASSVFSDSNPFKRKPEEPRQGGDDLVEEIKKKKRTQEESLNLDEASPVKKVENKGSADLGLEGKRKKKRKRDDVEKEYEERKYGAATAEEEVKAAAVEVGKKRKKADNEVDLLVSKEGEGFDDENKLLRTVFVGNLPLKVKKKALLKEFSRFGEVESVRIRSVPIVDTKIPRKGAVLLKKINDSADRSVIVYTGAIRPLFWNFETALSQGLRTSMLYIALVKENVHAYIVFKTEDSAEASLAHNMAVFAGNHIRVDRACPPHKKLKGEGTAIYDNKRTVFVGNLPFDVKDEELYQLFSGIKDLESSIEAVRVIRDQNVGLGKGIAYVLFKTAEAAKLVVRKRFLKIRDRELRLSHAKPDSTPSKRRNPFGADTEKTPTKKKAGDSRTPERSGGPIRKADMSYQGLRANKSAVKKKVNPTTPKRYGVAKPNGIKREGKRPAVAKRKEKTKAVKDGGAPMQGGKKRKLDSRSPGSSNRKKQAKRFR
ncbi:hypothetical protein Tsubulata_014533 [Turnera subulata]|uniref:RRM domain-containing protein n=1 Tax=Turnera subulata TaxID=218843 RepID=A0A9Q0FDB2_9ROSI|nr:hypothetical protein Tsubulata_014533 [Turnera subulata]